MTYTIKAKTGDLTPYLDILNKYHRNHQVIGNWRGTHYEYQSTVINFKTQENLDRFIAEFEEVEVTERYLIIVK